MRNVISNVFKRSTLSFMSLALAFSTLTPLFTAPVAKAAASGPFSVESVCDVDGKVKLNFKLKQTNLMVGNLYYKTPFGNSDKHTLDFFDTDTWSKNTGLVSVPGTSVSAEVRGYLFNNLKHTYSVMTDAKNCDATAPTATVAYSTTSVTTGNVTATLTADEEVQDIATWTRISPTQFEKVYTDNTAETVTLVDMNGNNGSADVNIDWIVIPPACTSNDTSFDTFALGSVNGQSGWKSTGAYDQTIVENIYGFMNFGCKSLRISNAITTGAFGDQTFSYSAANEAGETSAENNGLSGGDRKNRYEAEFDFASTTTTQQEGLVISVSPDRGDGARMSYLRFEDKADGIHVFFDDYLGAFREDEIAVLDRSVAHNIKFVMDFVDGPSNDIVNIYINGSLAHTGTSWEDYFRYVENNPTRTVDSILFRTAGASAPATSGKGFLIDNVVVTTGTTPVVVVPPVDNPDNSGTDNNGGSNGNGSDRSGAPVFAVADIFGINDDEDKAALGTASNDEGGEVAGATDNKEDKGCGIFLGICWYYWIPIVIAILAAIYGVRRKLQANS